MDDTTNDFPAVTGRTVTERHARICRENGHATHTVNGADSGLCPRCGEVTAPQEIEVGLSGTLHTTSGAIHYNVEVVQMDPAHVRIARNGLAGTEFLVIHRSNIRKFESR